MYPAALTALGLVGHAYILGGQIEDVRDDLRDDLGGRIQEVKLEIKSLSARQAMTETHAMASAEKVLMDCGKKKLEICYGSLHPSLHSGM